MKQAVKGIEMLKQTLSLANTLCTYVALGLATGFGNHLRMLVCNALSDQPYMTEFFLYVPMCLTILLISLENLLFELNSMPNLICPFLSPNKSYKTMNHAIQSTSIYTLSDPKQIFSSILSNIVNTGFLIK